MNSGSAFELDCGDRVSLCLSLPDLLLGEMDLGFGEGHSLDVHIYRQTRHTYRHEGEGEGWVRNIPGHDLLSDTSLATVE